MADVENTNINFVLQVGKYPCLSNSSLPSYSRKTETDKAWAEIGKTMKMTGAACKAKWQNLRVVYLRHMKPMPNGAGNKKKKPYYLLDYMHFIKPYLKTIIPSEAANLPSSSSTEDTEVIKTSIKTEDISNDENSEHETVPTSPDADENFVQTSSNSKRRKAYSIHETDEHFIKLKPKSTRLNESQTSNDSVMSFLHSLAPELKEMNLQQFKIFKKKVLGLIDDNEST